MTKTYHMRISHEGEALARSDVIFTREQFSQALPLRPLAIRQDLDTLHCSASKYAPLHGSTVFERSSTSRSAFHHERSFNDEASPKYYLPMKRCSSRHDVKLVMQKHQIQCHPINPDTMMSSSQPFHSTPRPCHSQYFDFSPPILNYQSPNFLFEHEKSVPANILLPSL